MTPELQQQIATDQRLERMEETLRRICFELDLAINGIKHLLTAQGHRALAENIAEQLELAHQERLAAIGDRERLDAAADTLPPEAQ